MPPGCSSQVHPLDVVINKPFKNAIKEQLERHLDENLDEYVDGQLTLFDRRVLTTNCVGNAWEKICQSKDMIIRSFKKCDITTNVDWSENSQSNILGLEDYVMPALEKSFI